jgi:hypothetical protein
MWDRRMTHVYGLGVILGTVGFLNGDRRPADRVEVSPVHRVGDAIHREGGEDLDVPGANEISDGDGGSSCRRSSSRACWPC